MTPGVGDHITARSTAARPVLMCQRGRSTRGSGYHEPAGRVSATTTRRRRLTLFIRTELGASDGTYGYRRITAALRPRGRGRVDREAVRTRPCAPRARQAAQPRRKDPAPPPPAAGPRGSRPDLVKRDSRRRQARESRWVGDIHLYPHPGRDPICLATVAGCCTKKAVGYAIGATTCAPSPLCEAIDMAARRCPTRRGKTIHPAPGRGTPVHLRPARQAPERLRHSSFGGQDRGALGQCLGGSRRVRPSRNERVYQMVYPTRSKAIRDTASQVELEHTIRNDSSPPWGTGRRARPNTIL